jgi:NADH dehydrogenase/NADH:ubiquinone oxidoreductase subunit G
MSQMVKYRVNGHEHEAEQNASLLGELRKNGYEVPSLCFHEALSPYGACRLCLVEVKKGRRQRLTTSCNYPVQEGIEVHLDTEKVQRNRRMVLELLLAQAPKAPKELHRLAARYGVGAVRFPLNGDEECILCGLCARACSEGLGADALTFSGRGDLKRMGTPYATASADCVGCEACARTCPTGAIHVEEGAGKRTIWGRTFTLARCPDCGGWLLPPEQIALLVKRSGLAHEYFERCETCRRRDTADRFKAVMDP